MSKSTATRDDVITQSYEQLQSEHKTLEKRLEKLKRPRSLSPEENAEIQRIKKRKLAIKDQMRSIEA